MIYLASSRANKEQIALDIKERQRVRSGLVAVLSCVEPCRTWFARRNHDTNQMGAVGRRLRLLRAHGLIRKVSKTRRYVLTEKGRRIITALLAARQASTEKLTSLAA